jgi:hypothetical protein
MQKDAAGTGPRQLAGWGPGDRLGALVMVVVVMMVMVIRSSGKSRAGEDHEKQRGGKNLLHDLNRSTVPVARKCSTAHQTRSPNQKRKYINRYMSGFSSRFRQIFT